MLITNNFFFIVSLFLNRPARDGSDDSFYISECFGPSAFILYIKEKYFLTNEL